MEDIAGIRQAATAITAATNGHFPLADDGVGQRLRQYNGKPNALSIDDATLATLAKMKGLETLSFDEVRLTHAGLTQLKALPNLKKLILQRADISEEDIAKLRADLPSVTLEWKPLTDVERKALDGFLKP